MARENNRYFTYTNPNPKNLKSTGDCVIRAICIALNQDWQTTFNDLCALGAKMCRMPNDDKVFEKYLKERGWNKNPQPRKSDNTKFTVREFLKYKAKDTCILRTSQHLVCASNGKVLDTWDCSEYCVGTYYSKG